jgi:YVTN family beta-propeller protein
VAVSPDGRSVYVPSSGGVSVIGTATNTVTATIPISIGGGPGGVAVSPDGRSVYVANGFPASVSVISTATDTVTATIGISNGSAPAGVAVTPNGRSVYVANSGAGNVSVIETATNTVTATIAVGTRPIAFGVFIRPAPRFTGAPGTPSCYVKSVSALVQRYGGLPAAAAALGYSSVIVLKNAVATYCAG